MDPDKRIDEKGIRAHKFFEGFDWKAVESESLSRVPVVPVRYIAIDFDDSSGGSVKIIILLCAARRPG